MAIVLNFQNSTIRFDRALSTGCWPVSDSEREKEDYLKHATFYTRIDYTQEGQGRRWIVWRGTQKECQSVHIGVFNAIRHAQDQVDEIRQAGLEQDVHVKVKDFLPRKRWPGQTLEYEPEPKPEPKPWWRFW